MAVPLLAQDVRSGMALIVTYGLCNETCRIDELTQLLRNHDVTILDLPSAKPEAGSVDVELRNLMSAALWDKVKWCPQPCGTCFVLTPA